MQVGGNFTSEVNAIEIIDEGEGPRLCAAGRFSVAGGVQAQNIAVWDGISWTPLGLGVGELQEGAEWVFSLTQRTGPTGRTKRLTCGGVFWFENGYRTQNVAHRGCQR